MTERKIRPYLFYNTTSSVCTTCHERIEAKILIQDDKVFMEKWCPTHGLERVLVSDDAEYYRQCRELWIKPPDMPLHFATKMSKGCPWDCGLCPDHMQHSCLTVMEITDRCNLRCPVCYANSSPDSGSHRTLAEIEHMLDALVKWEGEPDVLQISGGEPTLHPDFFAILAAARARPIRHLMINTNGLRIAQDPEFVEQLAQQKRGLEIYLQFDSMNDDALQELRGARLSDIRLRALERLNQHNISTTLVVTLKKGVNDKEIGDIIRFGIAQPCVRGVTFQPVEDAGRNESFDPKQHRLTVSEIRRKIAEQSDTFTLDDIVPVPCNPDSLGMGYALKFDGQAFPLTRFIDRETLLGGAANTIVFERDPRLKDILFKLFSTNHSPESQAHCLADLLCCLPRVELPENLGYENVFRVLIVQFMDAQNLDIRALKKSCVHVLQTDGKMIPMESFNIFHRKPTATAE